ncbi:MAG: hypothetical protein ABG776_08885 [Cyanobacteria bacterium J06555_13]
MKNLNIESQKETASYCLVHIGNDSASYCLVHTGQENSMVSSERPTVSLNLNNLESVVA